MHFASQDVLLSNASVIEFSSHCHIFTVRCTKGCVERCTSD